MTAHKFIDGPFHRIRVQYLLKPNDIHDVVGRTTRHELVKKPDSLLSKRKRAWPSLGTSVNPLNVTTRVLGLTECPSQT